MKWPYRGSDVLSFRLQPLSAMEYENCLPESIQRIISLDLINKMIAKCNGILQKKFIGQCYCNAIGSDQPSAFYILVIDLNLVISDFYKHCSTLTES